MKLFIAVLVVVVIGAIGFVVWTPSSTTTNTEESGLDETSEEDTNTSGTEKSEPASGDYIVQSENSIVNWAGQKPLIEGYVNVGSIAVSEGNISVGSEGSTGNFTIDMNTLSVSDTPTKPGRESSLEGHLKGERWFDVGTYPEASFNITSVEPGDTDSHTYQVEGELTMKGVTDTVVFPATIYQDAQGLLRASANFEFDRTKWGITSGSGSFFDNLADNVVDDMVKLSFELVAEKQ